MAVASLREMKDQVLTDLTNDDIKIKFIEESKKEGQKNYEAFQKRENKNKELQEEHIKTSEIKKYQINSQITKKVQKADFKIATFKNEKEKKYFNYFKNYCKHFDEVKKDVIGILITGNPGTGKSFVTSCIYNELQNRYKVYRFNFSFYIETLKQSFNEMERLNLVKNSDLIIIDDLGNEMLEVDYKKSQDDENTISWRQERMFNLFQEIYENEIPVIINTNLTFSQLNKFLEIKKSDKLLDRLIEDCKHLYFDWESKRADIKKDKFKKYFGE